MQGRWHLHSATIQASDRTNPIYSQIESMTAWLAFQSRILSMVSLLERSLLVTLLMTHLGKCRRTQHEPLLALHWDKMVSFVLMATVKLHSSIRGHRICMVSMPHSAAFASVSSWMGKNWVF